MLSSNSRSRVSKSPRVGLLQLTTRSAIDLAEVDAARLSRLFASVVVTRVAVPRCEVLFLDAGIAADGGVTGAVLSLREMVLDCGARIVVVATENPPENYIKVRVQPSFGRANMVMRLDRRGCTFESFFWALFSNMQAGASMPDAWMELTEPPGPNFQASERIFSCEIGPLTFG